MSGYPFESSATEHAGAPTMAVALPAATDDEWIRFDSDDPEDIVRWLHESDEGQQ